MLNLLARRVVALIFCPAFVQAANYLILGLLITKFGYVPNSSAPLLVLPCDAALRSSRLATGTSFLQHPVLSPDPEALPRHLPDR